jgi:hypothetical protein
MPFTQTALGAMNTSFGNANIASVPVELFEPGTSLVTAVKEMGLDTAHLGNWLRGVPDGLQEAIRATIFSALNRDPRSAITFSWAPAFDYELSIWDVAAGPATPGGITILLKSPYER